MYEQTVAKHLLETVEKVAREHQAPRVIGLRVWIGALSDVEPDTFREQFARQADGTVAAGAELDIEQSDDLGDPDAQSIQLKSVELP